MNTQNEKWHKDKGNRHSLMFGSLSVTSFLISRVIRGMPDVSYWITNFSDVLPPGNVRYLLMATKAFEYLASVFLFTAVIIKYLYSEKDNNKKGDMDDT